MSAPVSTAPSPRTATPPPRPKHARVPEVDWLRTLIVLAIIPYHVLILFSAASTTVLHNTFTNEQLPVVFGLLEVWGIGLIFLLAGAASKFALNARPPVTYVKERILRLLIPVGLAMIMLAPLRAYFLLLSNPELISVSPNPIAHPEQLHNIGTFFQYYWTSLVTTGSPIVVHNSLAHLWFVPRLLAVTLICVPLFLYLRERWPRWLARVSSSRVVLPALLLAGGLAPAIAVAILLPGWLNRITVSLGIYEDWTMFALDFVLFVYGYLIYSSADMRAAVRRVAYPALALAGVFWGIVLGVRLSGLTPANEFSPANMLFSLVQICAVWLLILTVLGLAMRYLAMSPAWLRYLATACFPVYILHLPILTIAAFYLQALPIPWYALFVLVTLVTLAASFALYEYVVRRVPVIRFLFGVPSPRPREQTKG